jgi:deoxyadenosine/deoxycytidine kinase
MLCDNGEMCIEEFELYKELLENMLEHVKPPTLMIYLEVSVEEAMARIKKRGREYEQVVEKAYWEKLNDEYRTYFDQYNISPILKINVDGRDFENNEADRKYILEAIKTKLSSL